MSIAKEFQASKKELENKVILVSGGGSGIGKEAALAFAECGAEIVLLGKNSDHLEETYNEFEARKLRSPILHQLDLETATEEELKQINNALIEEFGKLDGLLNNASILGDKSPIESYKYEVWKKVFDINVHATFLLTKSLLPALRISKEGSIIFTSSGVGRVGKAYWGAYSLSKFAIESLGQILSDELENTSNIRVNSINPGAVRTKIREQAYPAENPKENKEAKEILNAYLYLMSSKSIGFSGNSIDAQ